MRTALSVLVLALAARRALAQGEGEDRTGGSVAPAVAFAVQSTTAAVIPSTPTPAAPLLPPPAGAPGPDVPRPGGPQSPATPSNPGNPGPAGSNVPRDGIR